MALIEADHPALSGNDRQFWQDQLQNTRVLLFEYNKAILLLEREGEESYTIDTGQTTTTFRRQNLSEIIKQLPILTKQIQDITAILEAIDNAGNNFVRVVPF
jgi:hypothetical protein